MARIARGIGPTLFLAFSAAALPVLLAFGLLVQWQSRRALEAEFGRRVESLAASVSAGLPAETWQLVLSLRPGEEESRTATWLRDRLQRIATEVNAEEIGVWTLEGRWVLAASGRMRIGSPAPRAALMGRELEMGRRGSPASTPLFRSETGRWVKVGVAPIRAEDSPDRMQGFVFVSAPSESLGAITTLRSTLVLVGVQGWLLFLAVALGLARRLTQRTRKLTAAAQAMERGDLETTVPPMGTDEIGILADALEHMRAAVQVRERQLRAMVGGVAHEIRNPLGGLTLFAEMLVRDEHLTDRQRHRAQRILAEAMRLERVVNDFLQFARPERPRRVATDLAPVVKETAESAAAGLKWTGSLELPEGSWSAACDADHLRQILINLLRNAMEAAGGDGRVRVGVMEVGDGIEVLVEDSGSGISAEQREQIFEPFYSGKADGAGLGLAIARRLCDLGEMELSVDQGELGGARFRVRLRRRGGRGPGERGQGPDL